MTVYGTELADESIWGRQLIVNTSGEDNAWFCTHQGTIAFLTKEEIQTLIAQLTKWLDTQQKGLKP